MQLSERNQGERQVRVRAATGDDALAIARVLKSVDWLWTSAQSLSSLETAAQQFLQASLINPNIVLLVAEQPDRDVVGFIALHLHPAFLASSTGYVSHLFVREDARGKSVGRRLLHAVEHEAVRRNCKHLLLYISRHRPAYQRRFYEKAGWIEREDDALFIRNLE